MDSIKEKAAFLKEELTKKLSHIDPATKALWGKMNVPQMTEHMSEMFRLASGKILLGIETPEENIPKMQAFVQSDKPFRENTANKLLPDTPWPAKHTTIKESIEELQEEINHFFSVFEIEPEKIIPNPFFGNLNYELQVQLLYKHAQHHLRQFGAA